MECYFHPDKEAINTCDVCGKSICKECGIEIAGKCYCKNCIENIMGSNLENTQKVDSNDVQTPVFKDSAKIDNPYNVTDENIMEKKENYPEEKHFSSQPNIFKEERVFDNNPKKTFSDIEDSYGQFNEHPSHYNQDSRFNRSNVENEYDIIYPDHSYEAPETSARKALEDKYANYLDDLYVDDQIPLNEQLAKDEEKYGSLTKSTYSKQDRNEYSNTPDFGAAATSGVYDSNENLYNDGYLENQSHSNMYEGRRVNNRYGHNYDDSYDDSFLNQYDERPFKNKSDNLHNKIPYENDKEPIGVIDIILIIILIVVILIVIFYILFLLVLNNYYPTFLDAIMGLLYNPGLFFSNLLHK